VGQRPRRVRVEGISVHAVQRVMVEEGLGLDVAGGGEILTVIKAGSTRA
jgi:diaminopimelate decarboxylase